MAILPILLLLVAPQALAQSQTERALQLNEEMEFLLGSAGKPRIWRDGTLPPRAQRSGPAPSQMEGVDNLEKRFFSDEVSFQAARAERSNDESSSDEQDYRVDGSVPATP